MVSMKEIAKSCGVSVATVSKALSDKPDISKPTRDRIRKVAEEMGYMLNASARALKTNRTYNIGVLFIDRMSAGLA
ncbi:MAG: LacI family DNA-binding transcriptional regulator, partial [Erysipelotrichaceae bacterium]|nr:LacI family DNA-binding transcriptional regulator [Erysipelotrichaceae bacterium]